MRPLLAIVCLFALLASACTGETTQTTTAPEPAATTTRPETTTTGVPATTTTTGPAKPAEVVFTNGVVLTQDPELGTAEALAVNGETIVAVGADSDMDQYVGEGTRVVDLEGRTVIPGFVDAHTHILSDGSVAAGQPMALENGITTLAEGFINPDRLDTLVASSDAGQLRLRTNLYLIRTDNCGNDQGLWYEEYAPGEILSQRVRVAGVKVFADGGTCGPVALSEPYREDVETGTPFAGREVMEGYIRDADGAGYQLLIHAIGDLAIEQVMDSYEAVLGPGGASSLRHRIDHNSMVTPDLVDRYDELGVTGVVFGWLTTCDVDSRWTDFWHSYGDDPSRLLDANPNTTFAWHGDDPWVGPVSPLWEMFNLVTRAEPRDGEICRPSERVAEKRITRQQAFDLMTTGSAYALGLEEEVGSLAPGKHADLVILSGDPLSVDADELLGIEVLMTMIGGEVEHCIDPVCEVLTASTAEVPEASGECVAPPEGMASWWTGDFDASDRVGGNHGEMLGRTTIAPGVVGNALNLRASSVSLGSQPELGGGFTIEGWVNFDDPMAPFQTLFNNNQVFLRKNNPEEGDGLAVFVKLEDGSVEPRAQSPAPVEPGVWTHVAATWDGETLSLYVDGATAGAAQRSGRLTSTTVEARIGSGEQDGVDVNPMSGFIDELTIYDRALDPTEISAIAASGSTGKCG